LKLVHFLPWQAAAMDTLGEQFPDVEFVKAATSEHAAKELANADILVTGGPYYLGDVAHAVNTHAPKLRWIQSLSIGTDIFERGGIPEHITFSNAAGLKGRTVSEHAMALILTLNRKTHKAYNRVREGNFSLKNLIGFNVHKKTVGVIGTGQIGATFCKVIKGFGCRIIAFDISENSELKELGIEYLSLEGVFKQADIISLHCPLNENTKHIIDKASIATMKEGVMIINTSRGALINTPDAIDGLTNKKIGYLGIDVYEQEENLFFEDLSERIIQDELILRLMSFPNVLITSHQAFFTKEAMVEITTTTLENIHAFAKSKALENEVK